MSYCAKHGCYTSGGRGDKLNKLREKGRSVQAKLRPKLDSGRHPKGSRTESIVGEVQKTDVAHQLCVELEDPFASDGVVHLFPAEALLKGTSMCWGGD